MDGKWNSSIIFITLFFVAVGNWKELDDEQKMLSHLSLQIERDNIRLFSFPDYVDPNVKDDLVRQ